MRKKRPDSRYKNRSGGFQLCLRVSTCFIFVLCLVGLNSFADPVNSNSDMQNIQSENKLIQGKVTDENGEALIGVTIVVKGTTKGAITNIDGKYEIEVGEGEDILVFSFVGMTTTEIEIGDKTTIDIQLLPDTKMIDQVVVTALGIKKQEKSIGYAMQVVKTDELSKDKSSDIVNSLQGKVAGLQIAGTGNGVGSPSHILLRGVSSLDRSNRPLWIVDGVPIDDSQVGSSGGEWGGTEYGSGAAELNPDDIESISVLKGANAAALYGSRAQNGVIIITTKQAEKNQELSVSYNGTYSVAKVFESIELQDIYGQGSNGVYNVEAKGSWGPKMEGQEIEHWRSHFYDDSTDGSTYLMNPQNNRVDEFFRDGITQNHSLVFAGGGNTSTYRLSLANSNIKGITPGHEIDRLNINFNSSLDIDRINIHTKVNYIRTEGAQRPNIGRGSTMSNLFLMPMNIPLASLRPEVDAENREVNWSGPSTVYRNPYYLLNYANNNKDERDRVIGMTNVTYTILDWLKVSGRASMDLYYDRRESSKYPEITGDNIEYIRNEHRTREHNLEGMIMADKAFGDINVSINAGASKWHRYYERLGGKAVNEFLLRDLFMFNNAKVENQVAEEKISEKEIQSVYGDVQIGYRNYLFLEITGRNDWTSTLPPDNWSYFYPSVSLSGVITEMIDAPDWLTFLKLRTSYAEVGNDTDPYQLSRLYKLNPAMGGVVKVDVSGEYPLYDYTPERSSSTELGFDLRLLQNRFGVDFTYYNTTTANQIFKFPIVSASGYNNARTNAGDITNKGIEFMISATPVKTKDFEWNLNFNYSKNTNEFTNLPDTFNVDYKQHSSTFMAAIRSYEDGSFGDIISRAYVRDDEGNILVDTIGLPIITDNYTTKVGNIMPDWIGSLNTTFRYKGISLSALINFRIGGDILSLTEANNSFNGNSPRTLDYRDGGLILVAMVATYVDSLEAYVTSGANTKGITAEQYYSAIAGPSGVAEAFLYDASYIKLSDVTIGYELPAKLLEKVFINSAKVSLSGRNLMYFRKHTPGINPEGAFNSGDATQGFELSSLPLTRTFTINLQLNF